MVRNNESRAVYPDSNAYQACLNSTASRLLAQDTARQMPEMRCIVTAVRR